MENKKLPWWTWPLPFFIFLLGTFASLPFSQELGVYWVYFPINLGIIMAMWWGPRVLVSAYLNGIISGFLLNLPHPSYYPLYAIPETLEVALFWLVLKERFNSSLAWSPSPKNITLFFAYALFIPSLICSTLTEVIFSATGIISQSHIADTSLVTIIGDLTGAVFVSVPLFILLSPYLHTRNLSLMKADPLPPLRWPQLKRKEKLLSVVVLATCLVLGISLPLTQTWYVYGITLLLSSAWYGLYAALIMNIWIMGISFALPVMMHLPWSTGAMSLQTPSTLLTLCFCSLITGAAVTSLTEKINLLRKTESDLNTAKKQAEEASAAKSDFLARMSHEIRTPLNSILGMLELLKETQLNKDQQRYITLFSHAGENLKALINDLLDFSKIEAKALSLENVSFDLHSTIRSVFDILQIKAEEKGLHFELTIDSSVAQRHWGDPTRLRQILFNLIGNALKFTSEGSVIVRAKAEGEQLIIEVQDTGVGIPREKQGSLFSPFFQADPGITRKYGGTGLGLVISKNLAEIMGGTIEVKSLLGRGTLFRVLLPYRPDFTTATTAPPRKFFPWDLRPPTLPYRVLLVDDSEDNRVLMIHYLKGLPFQCFEATNGQEAVEIVRGSPFDVIFMDIQMPIMNGYKATETLRHWEKEKHLPHTPIIALTATAVTEDLQRTLASGCDSYLVKPVKKNDVLEALAHNLTTKSPENEAFKEPPAPRI